MYFLNRKAVILEECFVTLKPHFVFVDELFQHGRRDSQNHQEVRRFQGGDSDVQSELLPQDQQGVSHARTKRSGC